LKNPNLTLTEASLLDLTDDELAGQPKDCDAVVSCLGHVMDFDGIFGEPRRLCTDFPAVLPRVPGAFVVFVAGTFRAPVGAGR
jgi:hypothetical protein